MYRSISTVLLCALLALVPATSSALDFSNWLQSSKSVESQKFWDERELPEPKQSTTRITLGPDMEAVATYEVSAYVLAKKDYSSGIEADYSPTDLALGWGKMSLPRIIDQLDIEQSRRWYSWRYKVALVGITRDEVSLSSANTHIIPGNENVAALLKQTSSGHRVKMSGYLVNIKRPNGWRWNTSKNRFDSGAGACELFYVMNMTRLD